MLRLIWPSPGAPVMYQGTLHVHERAVVFQVRFFFCKIFGKAYSFYLLSFKDPVKKKKKKLWLLCDCLKIKQNS